MPATTAVRSDQRALDTSEGQTFLTGEEIYLRPFAPGDAGTVQSWRFSRFPFSPDRIRARLDDGEPGDSFGTGRMHLLVVRTCDNRPVGSVLIHTDWFPNHFLEATMDPLLGCDGNRWKGQALAMCMQLVVDEWHKPIIEVPLMADETATIQELEKIGARECIRFREMYSRDGNRVDGLMYEYLNRRWVELLGDPAERALPRSGTGEPRPVIAPVQSGDDPPANAVRVGPRVYLRPIQKDDTHEAVSWAMREDDTNWSSGRRPVSGSSWGHEMHALQKEPSQRWVRFSVCLRETDEVIGFVGVDDIDYQHRFGESESEMINPAYRGGGYGTEAKHLLFDYAFNTLGLHMLRSWVLFENTRSAAALRKQGYRDAGRVHWSHHRDGSFTHMGTFDLLAVDWRSMPRHAP